MQRRIIRDALLFLLALLLMWHFSPAKERLYQLTYDLTTRQQPVTTHQKIDAVLDQFEQLPISALEKEYLQWTQINQPKYQKILKNTLFYKIPGKHIFQFVVSDFRIKDLLPRDCLLYTSPSPRDKRQSRMPSSA